jgi:hypothetical protein
MNASDPRTEETIEQYAIHDAIRFAGDSGAYPLDQNLPFWTVLPNVHSSKPVHASGTRTWRY